MSGGTGSSRESGHTLLEAAVAAAVLGLLAVGVSGVYHRLTEGADLRGAVRVTRGELDRARMAGVARREVVRLRLRGGELVLHDADDRVLRRSRVRGDGAFVLDSIRLRPRTLRFNARGQAGPGSVYLYRGRRGVRLVVNFLGRVREERFPVRPSR